MSYWLLNGGDKKGRGEIAPTFLTSLPIPVPVHPWSKAESNYGNCEQPKYSSAQQHLGQYIGGPKAITSGRRLYIRIKAGFSSLGIHLCKSDQVISGVIVHPRQPGIRPVLPEPRGRSLNTQIALRQFESSLWRSRSSRTSMRDSTQYHRIFCSIIPDLSTTSYDLASRIAKVPSSSSWMTYRSSIGTR